MRYFLAFVIIGFYHSVSAQDKAGIEISVRNLGSNINSKVNDFQPFISRDGLSLYFASTRSLGKTQIFVAKRKSLDAAWGEAEYYKILNYQDAVFAIAFDDIGRMYCATNAETKIKGDLNIWQGFIQEGKITMKQIPSPVNTIKWEAQPSVTKDGSDLYFSSNRESPTSSMETLIDIFVAHRNSDETWVGPQSLGPKINLGNQNGSPFISPDGKFLFFSSREKKGVDIKTKMYMAEHIGPKATDWSTPILLPLGLNSTDHNDMSPVIARDGKTIYFASDRNSGSGLDIYEATLPIDIQNKIADSFPGY
jgi:Tol biopolymer transport system component